MKVFKYFPLWKIEDIESWLESMEQKGYRLEKIKHSYFFYFKNSSPKQMNYFISYKSFRGKSMGHCDYALLSRYRAHPIESTMCFYTMYRTKECKEVLLLLYEVRLDYIRANLFERFLTALFLTILFSIPLVASIIFQSNSPGIWLFGVMIGICVCFAIYYFYGYLKQKNKCKNYERDKLNR